MIYVTHVTRIMHASCQHSLVEQDRLHVKRGQLLLERSTWMMQARIQQIAENKLGMVIPDQQISGDYSRVNEASYIAWRFYLVLFLIVILQFLG